MYVEEKEKEHVAILLERGANKEARNTLRQTLIEFAVAQEFPESTDLLKDLNDS